MEIGTDKILKPVIIAIWSGLLIILSKVKEKFYLVGLHSED